MIEKEAFHIVMYRVLEGQILSHDSDGEKLTLKNHDFEGMIKFINKFHGDSFENALLKYFLEHYGIQYDYTKKQQAENSGCVAFYGKYKNKVA